MKKIVVVLLILALLGGTVVSLIMVAQSGNDPLGNLPSPVIRSFRFSDFRGQDLTSQDFTGDSALFPTFSFDSATKWPGSAKMPSPLTPERILEEGRYLGLGLSKLHKDGLTGKGVSIGVIGKPIRQGHLEYKDNLVYIPLGTQDGDVPDFESMATVGILAGKHGIAPNAKVFYFSLDPNALDQDPYGAYQKAIEKVLERQKALSQAERMKILVMPFLPDLYQDAEKSQKLLSSLKDIQDGGVLLLYPGIPDLLPKGAGSLPGKDRDKPESYSMWSWDQAKSLLLEKAKKAKVTSWDSFRKEMVRLLTDDEDLDPLMAEAIHTYLYVMALYRDSLPFDRWFQIAQDFTAGSTSLSVPCDYLTVPDPLGDDTYTYLGAGPLSLWFPYTAGIMALGLQVKPDLTQEEAVKALLSSGTLIGNLRLINPSGFLEALSRMSR